MRHLVLVPGVGRRADLRKLTHKISWQEGEEASQRLGWNGETNGEARPAAADTFMRPELAFCFVTKRGTPCRAGEVA